MPEPKRPLKVFLCHAHADRDPVRGLYSRLTQNGVDAWLDKEKLLPGQDWELEIRKAVREADVVAVCLSKQFNEDGFRQKEVKLALDVAMEKREDAIFIIPARLEECDNLESLRRWHWVNLFEEDGYEMLMRALRARADKIGVTLKVRRGKSQKIKKPSEKNIPKKNNGVKNSRTLRMFYDLAAHYECDIENASAETLASFLLESLTRIMRITSAINKSDENRTIEYRTDKVEYFDPKEGKTLQYALIVHGKKLQLVGKDKFRGVESLTDVTEMLIITITQNVNDSRLRFDSNNIPAEQFKELVREILLDFGKDISSDVKDASFEKLPAPEQIKPENKTNSVVKEEKPISRVTKDEFLVEHGKPRDTSIIAEFISRMSKGKRILTTYDVMNEFGDKAYKLLRLDGKLIGLVGWKAENLVSCITDIFIEDHVSLYKALSALIKEVEHSSNELQCEVSLIFPVNDLALQEDLWKQLNYERCTPETLHVQAWQDSAKELVNEKNVLFFKKLRPDRVLRPV